MTENSELTGKPAKEEKMREKYEISEKEIKVLIILDRIPFIDMGDIHLLVGIDEGELMPILETLIEKGLVSRRGKNN